MATILAILSSLFLLFTAFPQSSYALVISGDTAASTDGLGNFTGELTYTPDTTSAMLEVELTNTSPAANGGFITAFLLNNPLNLISNVSLSSTDSDFSLLGLSDNGEDGAPFGQFDFGASTGGGFEGGGDPSLGIAVTSTETFTFTLTGIDLNTLTDESFVDAVSVPPGAGEGVQFFVVRFRGFEDQGSDKVPGTPGEPIPEPGTLLLIGSGLVGLGAGTYRRRKKF